MRMRIFFDNIFLDVKQVVPMLALLLVMPLILIFGIVLTLMITLWETLMGVKIKVAEGYEADWRVAKDYVDIIVKAVPETKVKYEKKENEVRYILTTSAPNSLVVTLVTETLQDYDYTCTFVDIQSADTGYWHTGEAKDLIEYMDVATAALRGEWQVRRSLMGQEICFKVNKGWWCVNKRENFSLYGYSIERRQI